MIYLVWVVLIGILAGWLAGQITKGSGFGWLGDLIVGILGSARQLSVWPARNRCLRIGRPPGHGRDWRRRVAVADPVDQEGLGH